MRKLLAVLLYACACTPSSTKHWDASYATEAAFISLRIDRLAGDSLSITLRLRGTDTIYVDNDFKTSWSQNNDILNISYGTNMEQTPDEYLNRTVMYPTQHNGYVHVINKHILNHGISGAALRFTGNYFKIVMDKQGNFPPVDRITESGKQISFENTITLQR